MPVKYLELENFKSYAGHQKIGPFTSFSSVIGPNGSGKSNLMDAISFVLGVQSRDLRSSQMKDLIFRPGGNLNPKNQLRASATLVFEREEDDDNPAREIRYSRTISATGHGEYHVDGKTVSFGDYEQALADIGVLLKVRNFLVFQGDVESLARKSPAELVALIENISGSITLKEQYEQALQEKEASEQETLFAFKKQKAFRSERRLLKDQKEEAERFDQLLNDKATVQSEMYMWLLYHLDQDRQQREAAAVELQDDLDKLSQTEKEAASALKEAKKNASAARRQTEQTDKKRVQLAGKVDIIEPSIIKTTEEIKNVTKLLEKDEKLLTNKEREVETHAEKLAKLDAEIEDYKETQKDVEKSYDEIKRNAVGTDDVHLTEEQEQEYERVRQAAAAASAEPRRLLGQCSRQLETARVKAADVKAELDEAVSNQKEISKDVVDCRARQEKLTSVSVLSLNIKGIR
jgi:structural maintenance of chromosome 1